MAQSYDWLLFIPDPPICQFVEELIFNPVIELLPARDAFLESYKQDGTANTFTKVTVRVAADQSLKHYFKTHQAEVESWFNIIEPRNGTIKELRKDMQKLAGKDWKRIRQA